MRRLLMLLTLGCAVSVAQAALFDDFESYTPGLVPDVASPPWVGGDSSIVLDNWNQYLACSDVYAPLGAMSIPDSDTQTTVFYRVYTGTGGENVAIGVADQGDTSPDTWGDMDAYVQFVSGNMIARNGGGTVTLISAVPAGWYNVWLVINNSLNTYDVYINQGAADATGANRLGTGLGFRSGSTTPIVSFAATPGQGNLVDDIYITPGLDLTNPPLPSVPPTPFGWTGFLGNELPVENGGFTQPGTASVGFTGVPAWFSFIKSWSNDTGTRNNDNADGDGWHLSVFCPDGAFYNMTAVPMVEGETYTFTAQCRGRWNCEGVNMSVVADDDPNVSLVTLATPLNHDAGWLPASVTYTATAVDAGKLIGVKFEGTSATNLSNSWIRVDGVHLYTGYELLHGAMNPTPADGQVNVSPAALLELSWTPSNDPNMDGQTLYYYVGSEDKPNIATYNAAVGIPLLETDTSYTIPAGLDYDQYVLWRVDTDVDDDPNALVGQTWYFVSEESDYPPVVDAGSSYITWPGKLPQALSGTVDDLGEGDVANADVVWSITSTLPWVPSNTAMQMYSRAGDADLATLAANGYDPSLLEDWIGTDARGSLATSSEPLVLTLSGLLPGTYSWTSYHHDVADQTGPFNVTVIDSSGSNTTFGVDVTDGATMPVSQFNTTINCDGSDIKLIFDNQGNANNTSFFVMNGFVLSDGLNPDLAVDFGTVANGISVGYQAYTAQHEVAASFTDQIFSALGTIVTVLPLWGPEAAGDGPYYATASKTSADPLVPTATFDTNWPAAADYTITLTATDGAAQSGQDTLMVRVADNACAARQLSAAGYNDADFDQNCVVDLSDFAFMASQWLDDISLTESLAY